MVLFKLFFSLNKNNNKMEILTIIEMIFLSKNLIVIFSALIKLIKVEIKIKYKKLNNFLNNY